MARLIDADALIDFLDVGHLRHPSELCFSEVDVANLLLHAPTISPDEVRGVGEWEDNYPILVELECLRCKNCNKLVQIGRYCANCGERKKGAETWIKKKSRSQST